jgi:hypothetical protein
VTIFPEREAPRVFRTSRIVGLEQGRYLPDETQGPGTPPIHNSYSGENLVCNHNTSRLYWLPGSNYAR